MKHLLRSLFIVLGLGGFSALSHADTITWETSKHPYPGIYPASLTCYAINPGPFGGGSYIRCELDDFQAGGSDESYGPAGQLIGLVMFQDRTKFFSGKEVCARLPASTICWAIYWAAGGYSIDLTSYSAQPDQDADVIRDGKDNCPSNANGDQLNTDGDAQGNACDIDDDNDGVLDTGDNCSLITNADQLNSDGDAQGNTCDSDDDNDGIPDASDNFPLDPTESIDTDSDGIGNNADTDDDNDGVPDVSDNCQLTSNANQLDADGDGIGDDCDADINNTLDTGFNLESGVITPGNGAIAYVRTLAIQNDGKIIFGSNNRVGRLNTDGSLDLSYNIGGSGVTAGNPMKIKMRDDGKAFLVGSFIYNGANKIALLNSDGSLDTSFNPGSGPNSWVSDIVEQGDGKVVIVGAFTNYNGTAINHVARLNIDGSLDTTFNIGTGAVNNVQKVHIQSDGKIIIAGDFSSFNGSPINRIARLNADGSLDASFSHASLAAVYNVVLQADGKMIISVPSGVSRLNSDGSFDVGFNASITSDLSELSMLIQKDNKIIVGGVFTAVNGVTKNKIARLNADGSLDSSFNPGVGAGNGANNHISTMVSQADGRVVVAGSFTSFNSVSVNYIARIHTGDSDGDGIEDAADLFPNDSDNDGITNDVDADDDNDGMPDAWETIYGLNPLVNDAAGDLDADGFTNLDEFNNSTDPTVPNVTINKVVNDFNADGSSDVLFLNSSTGGTQYWQGAVKASTTYPGTYDTTYSYKGAGDFDGNGTADIFFTRATNNGTLIWNGAVKAAASYPGTSTAGFSAVAICDVNGDLQDDVIWHNTSTGGTQIWPSAVKAAATYPGTQNTAFTVAACADFDGDGSADIFWRNLTTGGNEVWLGASKVSKLYPGANTDLTWSVVGAGDSNGNLNGDLIWYKASTGATQIWEGGLKSAATYPGTNSTSFTPKAIGDYDGDGSADLLWSNDATLGTQIWPGVVKAAVTYPGAHSSGFVIQR